MGIGYLIAKRERERRGWDKAGERISQPSLLDRHPEFCGRSFIATLRKEASPVVGEELVLHVIGDKHLVARGPAVLADCDKIPEDISAAAREAGFVSLVKILEFNPLSGTIEVCPA